MSTIELKKQLIDKIQSIEDNVILEEVYRILDIGEDPFAIYHLSDNQINAIDKGLDDIKNGRITSHEDAKKEIDKWVGENTNKLSCYAQGSSLKPLSISAF